MFIAIANAIGAGKVASYISKLIKNFKTRVLLASGIFEAETCLNSNLKSIGSNILKQASLVITPTAYNAGTLFSVIPNTTLGDLDVTRATSATRVNANGLIEIPRTNLLLRSEEFDNATWTKTASTVTANATTSPSGTMTADKLVENNTNASHFMLQSTGSLVVGNTYFVSIYLKAAERNRGRLRVTGVSAIEAEFNLQNGTVSVANAIIQNVGNDWYRIGFPFVANATTMSTVISLSNSTTGNSGFNYTYLGDNTSGVFLWGAQLEIGNVATEYIPTTSAIRTRFAGITQDGGSANNIPRLDYTNASCPSILVEPQRTNLVLRSEEFDNATIWPGSAGVVRLANQAVAPNGTNTMDLITFPISGNSISQSVTVISGTTYTFSVWLATQSGTQTVEIGNINAGVFQSFTVTTTPQRFQVTQVASATNRFPSIRATANYSILIWGAQLEAGSNATSYIPTQASTVTRNADVISKTGVSSLIGQTEGTVYWDIAFVNGVATGTGNPQFGIRNTAFTNWIGLTSNNFVNPFRITARATTGLIIDYEANITSGKAAVAWSSAGVVLYVNGVQVRTSATNPNFSFDRIDMIALMTFNAKGFVLFPTRLDNATLQQLTTL